MAKFGLFQFQESEDDLLSVDSRSFREAVVFNTDWTTETVLNQLERGNIELDPLFQRRDAWRADRKSRFVESLILGMPVPPLVLAERKGEKGKYIVIDGKQRLLALRQFAARGDADDFTRLRLTSLTIRRDLKGISLQDLASSPALVEDLRTFENQTIRTVVVKNWPNEEFLYLLFLRLNTGSVPLSPQELRQALHPGEFVRFADTFSIESKSIQAAMGLKRMDFRMRDVELVIRYFAFRNFLPDYTGDLKKFLDESCQRLNKLWGFESKRIIRQAEDLNTAIDVTKQIFGRNSFRRFRSGKFEHRFNRAVFDIMILYFVYPPVGDLARRDPGGVCRAFERLSEEDFDFQRSLEVTTKTPEATFYRLERWGAILGDTIGMSLDWRSVLKKLQTFQTE